MTTQPLYQDRWRPRPLASGLLRAGIFAVPLLVAFGVVLLAGRALPPPREMGMAVLWWLGVTGAALVALLLVDRAARRLLPLATLLRLSLVFPDAPPSRYKVARAAASSRALRRRVASARAGAGGDATDAAETALALLASLHAHDPRTRGHSERVLLYSELLAEELGLDRAERDHLRWGALLHDIGKLAVPPSLLNKTSRPGPDEWVLLQRHPDEGMRLCAPLVQWLGDWCAAIGQHHERWDGSGYPLGLAGEQIGVAARIVAVADAYEVMTAPRPYARALPPHAARAELTRCAGAHFDPAVVRAFLNIALGRLRRAMGPLLLVSQVPILARLANASPQTLLTSGASASIAAVVGAAAVVGPAPSQDAEAVPLPTAGPGPTAVEPTPDGWLRAPLAGAALVGSPAEAGAPAEPPAETARADPEPPPPGAIAAEAEPGPPGGGPPDPGTPASPPAADQTPPAAAPDAHADPDPMTKRRGATPAEPADPQVEPAKPAQPPTHAQGGKGRRSGEE